LQEADGRRVVLVVIDSNVLISYFIRHNSPVGRAVDQILAQHTPIYSAETLSEFVATISRPKFKAYVDAATIRQFVDRYVAVARLIADTPSVRASRDPDDDKFLALALGGKADCIVTGDDDLLTLNPFQGIAILAPADFLAKFAAESE